MSNTAITTKVTGSVALTPNRRFDITRVKANAPISPIPTPRRASRNPCLTNRLIMSFDCAPSALRSPILCLLCNRIRHHAVDADRRQDERQSGEAREELHGESHF